ncbi:agmatine deiminase family protein [Pontixanthobacter sp. CEM42]|uniref:agmatine deiminase family protein n=1 Tax=Pontixanthobacter sp. CEM42 TaxID=2792077 RepID=UPI001ADEE5F0|nr:agmatine deiminase family protein [Pontixanthobacter sp. CEM42]
MNSEKELIVLAGPPSVDDYYSDIKDELRDFHIAYAKQVAERDDVLVLVAEQDRAAYADALGEEHVVIAPQLDIWMRDFTLSSATSPMMFRYTAAGQGGGRNGQKTADEVQEDFAELIEEAGVKFAESDWLNDGGNFVDDYAGRVVVSRKFLADNNATEKQAREYLTSLPNVDHVAFIDADEQGGLEHADGVVAFVEPNVLVINSYTEDPAYAEKLKADLRAGLPDVTIHEITTPYDGSTIYDERFGSACGLYTNMLVTPERIYFPQFGIPEDAEALASMREWTSKEIIPVQSGGICQMGGGVRCMSWQVRGETAKRMLEWALAQQ